MSDSFTARRAGFWRRFLAFLIDFVIVVVPMQIVVAILFTATSGHVQMTDGLTYRFCSPVQAIPDLTSPPPAQSNAASLCDTYFLGARTARNLIVARVTREGHVTHSVWRSYMVDASGRPIKGLSLTNIPIAILALYMIAMESARGATLGDRALGLRVARSADSGRSRASFWRVTARYLALALGGAPAALTALYFTGGSDPDKIDSAGLFFWLAASGVFALLWYGTALVQIVRKRDPIFDRIAGTAMLRRA